MSALAFRKFTKANYFTSGALLPLSVPQKLFAEAWHSSGILLTKPAKATHRNQSFPSVPIMKHTSAKLYKHHQNKGEFERVFNKHMECWRRLQGTASVDVLTTHCLSLTFSLELIPRQCFSALIPLHKGPGLSIQRASTELHHQNHLNRLYSTLECIPDRKQTTEVWLFCMPKNNSQVQLRHRQDLQRTWLATSYQNNLSTGKTNTLPPHISSSSSSRIARLASSSAAFPCAMACSRHCLEKRLSKHTRKRY